MTRRLLGLCLVCTLALTTGGCPDGLLSSNPTVTLAVDETAIEADGGLATVTATLDTMSMRPVEVALEFGGTAMSGVTYTRSATKIVIPSYATSGTITIRGAGRGAYNPDAVVTVSAASVTGGTLAADQESLAIAIESDATQPVVSLSLPEDTTEFDKDGGTIDVTATLSNPTYQEVTVALAFAGTAVNETDYTRTAESIVIAPGKTSGKITLTGADPDAFTANKSVVVSIDSVTNATETTEPAGQEVTATVVPASVTLALTGSPIAENAGSATLTATLKKATTSPVEIQFNLTGTAVKDTDYTASATSITIPANQTTGTLTLTSIADYTYDPSETIIVTVQPVADAAIVGNTQFTAAITDDYAQAGQRWLDANADEPGVVVLPSGLQYKVITAGPDPDDKPLVTDNATVNYVGTLMDGTQFDSNNNVEFTIANLIQGWQEALPLMSVGSNWILYVPADLGYGGTAQGSIPANSVLIFDMTLLSFTTP